jgi:hypothetical protein
MVIVIQVERKLVSQVFSMLLISIILSFQFMSSQSAQSILIVKRHMSVKVEIVSMHVDTRNVAIWQNACPLTILEIVNVQTA